MSLRRRSRLDVVARLARIDERRELTAFGRAQRDLRSRRDTAVCLAARVHQMRERAALRSGASATVAELRAFSRHLGGLRDLEASALRELHEAEQVEAVARERVTGARARVRGIDNAIARRRARDVRRQRRIEQRRVDELVRNLDALRREESRSEELQLADAAGAGR